MSDELFGVDARVILGADGYLDAAISPSGDFEKVSGLDNLKQQILLRILTRRGERNDGSFGSDVQSIRGARNIPGIRQLFKVLIYDALVDEPRIREIRNFSVFTDPSDPTRIIAQAECIVVKSFTLVNAEGHDYTEGTLEYTMNNQYVYAIREVRAFIRGAMIYMKQGKDYVQSGDTVQFLDSGRKPDNDTRFSVDYTYYDLSKPEAVSVPLVFPFNLGGT